MNSEHSPIPLKPARLPACLAAVCALTLVLSIPFALRAAEPAPGGDTLCVATFNLRYASAQPPNSWPQRRPVMVECFRQMSPDIVGTQEGLYEQLKDLASALPEYSWIGTGRDGGSRGEFMAVFYRSQRFEPLEYDHFWLSDTPEVIASSTWGNECRRMVTWVRFRDRQTQREFYFVNTHLDHQVQLAREKAASLIRERIAKLPANLPLLLVGDFNAVAGQNRAYDILVGPDGLVDLWKTARERRGEGIKSFHSFRGPRPGDEHIDWILARGPVVADVAELVTYSRDGQFPSDHFPVLARIRWSAP